jgi:hypothetical protein
VINVSASNIIKAPGVSKVEFAVWGDANGQNDLIWYQANKVSEGSYSLGVNVINHKETGTYNVHVYATLTNGSKVNIGAKTVSVPVPGATGVLSGVNVNAGAGSFQVKATGVNPPAGVSSARIAVWVNANQSDLRWYTATKQSDGSYLVSVNIANHGYAFGTYNAHMYAICGNGIEAFMGKTTINLTQPAPSISATLSSAQTVINVSAANIIKAPGVSKVEFAVWGDSGGQNDLIWYQANKVSEGSYSLGVNVINHKETGTYNVHVYATLTNGSKVYIAAKTFSVNVTASATLTGQILNASSGTFRIKAASVNVPSGVSSARIAIWNDPGQADLRWYPAVKQSDGTYTVDTGVANHGGRRGTYNAHMYVTCGNGIEVFAGATTVRVQ